MYRCAVSRGRGAQWNVVNNAAPERDKRSYSDGGGESDITSLSWNLFSDISVFLCSDCRQRVSE